MRRQRLSPPSSAEIAAARRLRQVRSEYGLTRSDVADHVDLTPDQLNRIERGTVALRFGPAWKFCEFTQTNPLWLAFGEPFPRIGFAPIPAISGEEFSESFISHMARFAETYRVIRTRRLKVSSGAQRAFAESRVKLLVEGGVKRYLASGYPPMTWKKLRDRLRVATATPGGRADLARSFKVSTAAVSQWLSGASAPKADTTLRLLQWVTILEAKKQTAPAASKRDRRKRPERRNQK